MSQQYPVSDETVRMPADGGDGRPAPTTPDQGFGAEPDDTRPVGREWQRGGPETPPVAAQPPPAPSPAAQPPAEPAVVQPPSAAPSSEVPAHAGATPSGTAPAPEDLEGTQRLDLSGHALEDSEHPTAVVPPLADGHRTGTADGTPPAQPRAGGPGGPWWRRRAVLIPAGAVAVLAATYGADLALASGDVPRSTVVAGVEVGGLSPARAAAVLEEQLAPRIDAEHQVRADDVTLPFSPATAGIGLDVDATVDVADDQPLNLWTRVVTLFSDREVDPVLTGEDTALAAQMDTLAEQVDRAPVDATIAIEGTTASVVAPQDGRTLDRDGAAEAITEALTAGSDPATPIELPVDVAAVTVDQAEAQRVLDETVTPGLAAPVAVVSQDGGTTAEVSAEAIAASLTFTPEQDGTLTVGIDPAQLQTALGDELGRFGTPAEDATFQISGGSVSVVPSVDGTGIDPAVLSEQLLAVLPDPAPRSVTAELGPVPADLTTEEAEALGIREEVSSFTTRISNPASGTNIRVVAAEVDGALVLPGETFSLNGYTGPRGVPQGYVEATVISGGQLSKAVGGGVSQFATTMFNAVFFAGLEDVYHKPHSFYIDRYPAGREATVYEGLIDLQWRNDSDTGIYVDTATTSGSLTVTFYGTKRYEIQAIEGPRTNRREPAELEKPDDGDCIPQSGVPGFDVTVTRVFRDLTTGSEIKREQFNTRYAAEAVIRCVPPEPAAPPAGPAGTTPGSPPSPGGRRPRPRAA
ncbi:VanW family protein [Blastococcus saxobsidens]|uniref:Vancomycin resistance protein YoaR n=1 Tax=Blastococcus saxobsidens TaxID=138336 RepID=A0A4Q7Y7U7_9ACTN|nr:VanW family protein [Blastococcus saxobsidens]RZU32323.1 vancomycin resistance protein YoaR [Blastococcus saxobsidens]